MEVTDYLGTVHTLNYVTEPNDEQKQEIIISYSQEYITKKMAENIDLMWKAAHDYETSKLQGSAIGLVTIGIMMQKPKCYAVQNWVKSIWALYYSRKPLITLTLDESLNDFSSCGPLPHSIPELMQELGM